MEAIKLAIGWPLIFIGEVKGVGDEDQHIWAAGNFALIINQPVSPRHIIRKAHGVAGASAKWNRLGGIGNIFVESDAIGCGRCS